ncbi:MAG: hypothetical protein ACOX4I_00830 [Anaerovoracaceae bacterium]|jgi:hypothetical protein
MILCPNDRKLLAFLKRLQRTESGYVLLYTDNALSYVGGFYYDDVQKAAASYPRFFTKIPKTSFKPTLNSLIEKGLLRRSPVSGVYQVTHDGWNNYYLRRIEVLKLVVTHVAFPSLVAFVTTVIANTFL